MSITKNVFKLNIHLFLLVLTVFFASVACENPVEPQPTKPHTEPPSPLSCEVNHTARVTFANESSRSTYDVLLNDSIIGTIGPGGSVDRTVAAGSHTVVFRFSKTNRDACNPARPNFAQCSSQVLSCRTDL